MTKLEPRFPVAVIGVGNMGAGMAHRLLTLGWPVHAVDLDEAKVQNLVNFGALAGINIAQVAIDSVVIIVCVVNAEQTEAVLFGPQGIAHALLPDRVVMLCPTLAPDEVEGFALRLSGLRVQTVDAPMSGGPVRAIEGSMSLMVACANEVFERHQALFEALSNKVHRISERVGDGARTKLVNNLAAGINLVGAAEVMVMAQKMGLDLAATLAVIEQSSGQSWIGSDRMRRAIAGDFEPRAHMTLLQKDTRLAIQAAQAAGFEGPLGARARDVFDGAARAGLADEDDAALFKWLNPKP